MCWNGGSLHRREPRLCVILRHGPQPTREELGSMHAPQLSFRHSKPAVVIAAIALSGVLASLPSTGTNAAILQAALGDWPMYGHDTARTNFNQAETAINRSTVPNLQSRWQANIGSNGVAPSGAPAVVGNRVYVPSSTAD